MILVLVAATSLLACGDDSEGSNAPVTPPERIERPIPTVGAPDTDEWDEPPPPEEVVPEDRVDGAGSEECCMVTFSYAPPRPEEVGAAVLRGSGFPLNATEGVALTESEGVWTGEACIAPGEYATYYYDVGLRTASDELFGVVRHNPFAPTTSVNGEIVNFWEPGDDCGSLDVAVHAKTSE
jgi:hypothetical protein